MSSGFKRIDEVLNNVIKELSDLVKEHEAAEVVEEAPKRKITLSEVRAKLAEISRSGKTAQVKQLLRNHKANKLSEVKEDEYESLMSEAEELANAR